ncbi:phage protein NinX family protein [Escherichia coli]|uniref:phage protein NinX family protein n=1 Tax=Escherichia coli TaxID=562 RepID=UPI0028AD115D|nr:phage protein NinX family protein [Escherichia coli]
MSDIGCLEIQGASLGLWKAAHRKVGSDSTPYHMTQDENPLRAAMIVFLMMQDANNA